MNQFHDLGDFYDHDALTVTCAACRTTTPMGNALLDWICNCGRVLNGSGRDKQPALPNVKIEMGSA